MEIQGGFLELIIGPMFSGKTNKLIQRFNEIKYSISTISNNSNTIYNERSQESMLALNYNLDTRYGTNKIISHDGNAINCLAINNLAELQTEPNLTLLHQAKYIFINEAQFFSNLKDWILEQLNKYNKYIILCGLDSDFKRERFGDLLDLIPHANMVVKLTGICSKCNQPSIYTHRITSEIKQEIIGTNNYIPVCRACYLAINP